eukprot:4604070-Pyramimonas_sp.AAC.2
MAPIEPRMAARCSQDGPRCSHDGLRWPQGGPGQLTRPPTCIQEALQEGPKREQSLMLLMRLKDLCGGHAWLFQRPKMTPEATEMVP